MTETVVTNKDNTVVVTPEPHNTVVTQTTNIQTIVTGIMGPPGASSIGLLDDVDTSELSSGSVLVYNTQTQKWAATTLLDQQVVEAGQF